MRQIQFAVRALSVLGTGALLAACSGSGSPAANTPPLGSATQPLGGVRVGPEESAKKGPGVFGVAFDDNVDVVGNRATGCSGPPSNCAAFVSVKKLKDTQSTESSQGTASLKTTAALGALSGAVKATSLGAGPSSLSVIYAWWEDTFTVTSKTLPPARRRLSRFRFPFHRKTFTAERPHS